MPYSKTRRISTPCHPAKTKAISGAWGECVSVVCRTTCVIRATCDARVVTWSSTHQLERLHLHSVLVGYRSRTSPCSYRHIVLSTCYDTLPRGPVRPSAPIIS